MLSGTGWVTSSPGIVVAASGLGKFKSIAQYTALCILIFPLGVLPLPFLHDLGLAILYISLILTLWSGGQYFYRFQQVFLPADNSYD